MKDMRQEIEDRIKQRIKDQCRQLHKEICCNYDMRTVELYSLLYVEEFMEQAIAMLEKPKLLEKITFAKDTISMILRTFYEEDLQEELRNSMSYHDKQKGEIRWKKRQ